MKKTNKIAAVLATFAAVISASMLASCSNNDDAAFQAAVAQAKSKSAESSTTSAAPVPNVPITSLTLKSANSVSLVIGQRTTLEYEYEPKNATPAFRFYWHYGNYPAIASISNASNGKVTVVLSAVSNTDIGILYDSKTSKEAAGVSVAVTLPTSTPVALTAGTAKSSVAADYKFATVDFTNAVAVYTVNLNANIPYIFECAKQGNDMGTNEAGLGNCAFALYDHTWNNIRYNTNGNIFYRPDNTGNFYFVIMRDPYDSSESAKGGVHVYATSNLVTGLTLSETSLSLKTGETKTITITPTPANPDIESYTWSTTGYGNGRVAPPSISGKTITVTGGIVGTETFKVIESCTNYEASFTVTVTVDSSKITEVLPVGTSSSTNASDYTHVDLSDSVPAKFFKLVVDSANSSKTYNFQCADSDQDPDIGESLDDCYFYLYDSSFNNLDYKDHGTISQSLSAGTYYFAITRYNPEGNRKGAVHVYVN